MSLNKRQLTLDSPPPPQASSTKWIMTNDSGELYYSESDNASSFAKSTVTFNGYLDQAVYDGYIWVAATRGSLYYTADITGLSGWTEISGIGSDFNDVARTNDRWFAFRNGDSDLYSTTDLTASSGWQLVHNTGQNGIGPLAAANGYVARGARISDSSSGGGIYVNSTQNDYTTYTTVMTTSPRWGTGAAYDKDNDIWIFTGRNERVGFTANSDPTSTITQSTQSSSPADFFYPIWDGTRYIISVNSWYAYSTTSAGGGSWTTGSVGANIRNWINYNGTVHAGATDSLTVRYSTNITGGSWSTASVSSASGTRFEGLSPSQRKRHGQWSDFRDWQPNMGLN